ncbi:hypothetical protein Hanom_Chr02g00095251 [Helianthus anomalus]
MIISITFNTLTVDKWLIVLYLGGFGMGWAVVFPNAIIGWGCNWVGVCYLFWCLWDGLSLGWVGDIRGERVVKPVSSSGRLLVACFSLFTWSLGVQSVFLPFLCLRWLFRGLHWSLLICVMPGIGLHPGDIRRGQLGGLFFWCCPICSPTPMLETKLGHRNRLCLCCNRVGMGWFLGWDSRVVTLLGVFMVPHSLSMGGEVILGWGLSFIWMMLDRDTCVLYGKEAKRWVHQSGVLWRSNHWLFGSVWVRGNYVIKGWGRFLTAQYTLVLLSQVGCKDWLVKKTIYARYLLYQLHSIGQIWAWYWFRIVRVGINVSWDPFTLEYIQRQSFFHCRNPKKLVMQNFAWFWFMGILVLPGCESYHQMHGFYRCPMLGNGGYGCCKGLGQWCGLRGPILGHLGWVDHAPDLFSGYSCLLIWAGIQRQPKCISNGLGDMTPVKTEALQCNISYGPALWEFFYWVNGYWSPMLRAVASRMCSLRSNFMKARSVGIGNLLHDLKAWAWIPISAWIVVRWAIINLGWVSCKMSYSPCFWGVYVYSPVLKYSHFLSVCGIGRRRIGNCIPCYARFFCIPSVGRMVSYFWSPKLVLGDVTGGMPPLKV